MGACWDHDGLRQARIQHSFQPYLNMKSPLISTLLLGLAFPAGANEKAPAPATGPASHPIRLSLDTGYSQGEFQWTIAGNENGNSPNILSDLDWQNMRIVPIGIKTEVDLWGNWKLRGAASYGRVISGKSRDSDYDGNNRSGEFSRSYADADGSHTVDVALELGYTFHLHQQLTLTPWLGGSYHQQFLGMTNGVSVLDDEGPTGKFSGLDSSYDAKWLGGSLGLDMGWSLTANTRILLGARYELLQYEGKGDWNLRDDIRYFDHKADGYAFGLKAGVEWDFTPSWTLGVLLDWATMRTSAGVDRSYFTDGTTESIKFNGARWEAGGIRAGLTYRF